MPEIYGTRSRKMEVTYDYYRIFYYAAKYKKFFTGGDNPDE